MPAPLGSCRPTTILGGTVGVPLTAFELVLEELHLCRRAALRDFQEDAGDRMNREHGAAGGDSDFSSWDLEGATLGNLSLVHSSWTSVSRRVLGRILIRFDPTVQSAQRAASSQIFGSWTREIHLLFPRDCNEGNEIWDALRSLFSLTPSVLYFCLITSSSERFRIHLCVKHLSGMLCHFTRLRALRLYNDISHGCGTDKELEPLKIAEHSSLFHALEKCPNLECFVLRNFIPCMEFVHPR